MYKNIDLHYKM